MHKTPSIPTWLLAAAALLLSFGALAQEAAIRKTLAERLPNLPKIDHYHQWVDAAMGTGSCAANLDYAVPLTISNLLGVVATGFPGQSLAWNSETMKFSNNDAANGLLTANYRKF